MDYPALMDPRTMGILSAAFQGLQASGPSRMPVSLGQVIGQAGQAGLGTFQNSMEAQRKYEQTQAIVNLEKQRAQMEEMKIAQAARQAAMQESILGPILARLRGGAGQGPAAAPGAAVGAPSGVPAGPVAPGAPAAARGGPLGLTLDDVTGLKAAGFPDLLPHYKEGLPNISIQNGFQVDPRVGVVGSVPQTNQQGFSTQTVPDGKGGFRVVVTPGAAEAYQVQQDIGEGAKARRDLVRVPATAPGQPPREMTREQRINEVSGGPVRGEIGGATINISQLTPTMIADAVKNADKDPETFKLIQQALQGQAGQAAGMSPQAEAQQAADAAQGKSVAENYGKIYNDLQNASMQNPAKIAKFQKIGELLNGFEGGKYSKNGYELARAANSAGLKIDSKLPNKEAAEAMASEIALELRSTSSGGGMPGAMSDADREFLKGMAPNMAQTDQGRKAIISARVKVMERESKVADMARQYRKRYGKIDDDFFSQLQDWSNRNPVFGKK